MSREYQELITLELEALTEIELLILQHHRLTAIEETLSFIKQQLNNMALTLDDLTAKVQKDTDAENSAITLLQGISAQLAAAKNDPAKIQALADQLDKNASTLAAAVVANTPAA